MGYERGLQRDVLHAIRAYMEYRHCINKPIHLLQLNRMETHSRFVRHFYRMCVFVIYYFFAQLYTEHSILLLYIFYFNCLNPPVGRAVWKPARNGGVSSRVSQDPGGWDPTCSRSREVGDSGSV